MSNSPIQVTYNLILSFQYYDEYLNLIDDVYSAIRNKSQMDEERVWNDAEIMNNDAWYQDYITRYPDGKYVSIAQSRIGKFVPIKTPIFSNEESVWNDAEIMNNDAYYRDYISRYPNGKYVAEAKKRIQK